MIVIIIFVVMVTAMYLNRGRVANVKVKCVRHSWARLNKEDLDSLNIKSNLQPGLYCMDCGFKAGSNE